MSEHNYKFEVAMSCGGCSGAIERVLKKLDGEPVGRAPRSTN
jgi:copper chaperone